MYFAWATAWGYGHEELSMCPKTKTQTINPRRAAASCGLIFPPIAASFKTQFALINRRKSILTAYDAQWRGHKSPLVFHRKSRAAFAKARTRMEEEKDEE